MKDWSGNSKATFSTLGASNHSDKERELYDYYATDPKAAVLLMEQEEFSAVIFEPACGEGHLAEQFKKAGYHVVASDLIKRNYDCYVQNFFDIPTDPKWKCDIVTNPPYNKAQEFIEHALNLVDDGFKVCMFLKIQFLEGKKRRELFKKYPPKTVYVSSSRIRCAMNGDFENAIKSSAVCYAWFVWVKGYHGDPVIKWIN